LRSTSPMDGKVGSTAARRGGRSCTQRRSPCQPTMAISAPSLYPRCLPGECSSCWPSTAPTSSAIPCSPTTGCRFRSGPPTPTLGPSSGSSPTALASSDSSLSRGAPSACTSWSDRTPRVTRRWLERTSSSSRWPSPASVPGDENGERGASGTAGGLSAVDPVNTTAGPERGFDQRFWVADRPGSMLSCDFSPGAQCL
jgi:hypothetical protein